MINLENLWVRVFDLSGDVARSRAMLLVGSAALESQFMEADYGPMQSVISENAGNLNALLLEISERLAGVEMDLDAINSMLNDERLTLKVKPEMNGLAKNFRG